MQPRGATPDPSIVSLLRRSALCQGLSREELLEVAAAVRPASYHSGDVICQQNEVCDRMYLIARGRVRLTTQRADGEFRLLETLGPGDHFGELALVTDTQRTSTATAVMDTQLLELDKQAFVQLMVRVPGFAVNLSRSLGFRLHWQTIGQKARQALQVVGLVHAGGRTMHVAPLLAEALAADGETIHVLCDRRAAWPTGLLYLVERIPEADEAARAQLARERLHQVLEHHERVLVEQSQHAPLHRLAVILTQCEEVWWLAESDSAAESLGTLRTVLKAEPRLAPRTRVVWVLREHEHFAPRLPADLHLAGADYKLVLGDDPQRGHRLQQHTLRRLIRRLQGTRIGLALGGGGARGLAHLGVLRALDRAGIVVDVLAGTSSGALMALPYAAGYAPEDALPEFTSALTPPRLVRMMPGGYRWYLWAMFRAGAWDRMLRPYFGTARLEQLLVPLGMVAVDLVRGQQVVRHTGDCVEAVLESINFPPAGRPILRDGMALVDGGLLNNLPVDVVHNAGAQVVIGVDVVSKLPQQFAGNTPQTPTEDMRPPSMMETLLRAMDVRSYGLSDVHNDHVDVVIRPDTSAFEFADFTQGARLAEVGEAAAEEAIPRIRELIASLDIR
jgi:NTE family protein